VDIQQQLIFLHYKPPFEKGGTKTILVGFPEKP
jgi:hypothetical protein